MMKKLFLPFILAGLSSGAWGAVSASVPTIDFGTIYYCPDGSGYTTVSVPADNGLPAPTGNGGDIANQSGGSPGTTTVSKSGFLDWITSAYFYTKKSASATVNGCGGSVTITNATTESGKESANGGMFSSSYDFPVGADLIVNSFSGLTGTGAPCSLSGTVSGLLAYSAGSSSFERGTALNLTITAQIVPATKIAHNESSALNFGSICFSNRTQTITVSSNGAVTSYDLDCPPTADITADVFNVVAPIGLVYNVTVPASATLTNGVDSLTLTGITPSCISCTMTGTTQKTLNVGGTLTIPSGASPGDYLGNYEVRITY